MSDPAALWAALLKAFDTNGDGKISSCELKHGLALLDKNKDGKLTKDELVAAGLTDAQASELMKSMDKNGDNSISVRGKDSEARAFAKAADSNNDRTVTQEELSAQLTSPGKSDQADLWSALSKSLDKNGDGKLSSKELKHGLALLDENDDGKLTKDELVAAGLNDAQASQLMKALDTNGDNSISLRGKDSEARAFVKAADSNHDRVVTQEELAALLNTSKVDPNQTATGAAAC